MPGLRPVELAENQTRRGCQVSHDRCTHARKGVLSREVATQYAAHANDSYVTVITLNGRVPICRYLNKAFSTNAGKKPEDGSRARCAGRQKEGKKRETTVGPTYGRKETKDPGGMRILSCSNSLQEGQRESPYQERSPESRMNQNSRPVRWGADEKVTYEIGKVQESMLTRQRPTLLLQVKA